MCYLCYLCLLAYSGVKEFVLLYVFTFFVPCCDVFYDFGLKTMLGTSFPPVVCRGFVSYLCQLYLLAQSGVKNILTIWVTWRVSYKRHKLLIVCEHLDSALVFSLTRVAHLFCFLYFALSLTYVLCAQYYQCLYIAHLLLPHRYSVFSKVYLYLYN